MLPTHYEQPEGEALGLNTKGAAQRGLGFTGWWFQHWVKEAEQVPRGKSLPSVFTPAQGLAVACRTASEPH